MARTEGPQPWRRALHATTGLVLAWVPWAWGMSLGTVLWILGLAFALLLALDVARLRVPALNAVAFRWLRRLISPREASGVASSTWYVLAAFLAYGLFPVPVAVTSILVLALADPAASLVGRAWGRRKVGKGSLEGALAFFAVASVVLLLSPVPGPASWPWALGVAGLVTAVEVTPFGLDDNLTVPLATAVALRLLLALG